jgi:DNA-binding transcriptional MerR regulator
MALFPVADGARLLGIHPKTLHHWLKEAKIPLAIHPTDARIKCVSEEHLHQVASLQGRSLQAPARLDPASPPRVLSEQHTLPVPAHAGESASPTGVFPTVPRPDAELTQKLAGLASRLDSLQEQVAQLALVLLHERERSVEQRISTLESLLQPFMGGQMPTAPVPEGRNERACPGPPPRPLHPAEQGARSRRPPLIEYCAPGSYVIVSSQEGEVHLQPDSRAWFDWLATLSSFRFVGPVGRFTAHRGYKQGQQTCYWSASRCVRRHTYKHYLGMTESLTLASLEHVAARLQSDIDAR